MAAGHEAFAGIGRIRYEGPQAKSMLAFRHYDPDALVEGKPMKEHFRFAIAYWHAFRGTGADPFGPGTMLRPWENDADPLRMAVKRTDVAFEFMEKHSSKVPRFGGPSQLLGGAAPLSSF